MITTGVRTVQLMQRRFSMALINCPKCGKTISDKAIKCPGCGYSLEDMRLVDNKDLDNSIQKASVDKDSVEKISYVSPKSITVSKSTLMALGFATLCLLIAAIAVTYALSYKKVIRELTVTDDIASMSSLADTSEEIQVEDLKKEGTEVKAEKVADTDNDEKTASNDVNSETQKGTSDVSNSNPSGQNYNKNITFSDDYVVDIDFEVTNIKTSSGLIISYKCSNNESFPIELHSSNAQYFDDIAVKKDWSELPNPIQPQKSAIGSITFYSTTITSTGINHIDDLTLRMYITDENGNDHPFEVFVDNANIDF